MRHAAQAHPSPAEYPRSPWPVESVLGFHYERRAAADDTLSWDGGNLVIPRMEDGGQRRRTVTLEEHLDGSLWVRDGTAHGRLAEAPPSAPVLRARHRTPLEGPEPAMEPRHPDLDERPPSVATTGRPAADHPWRKGYDRRRRQR